MKRLIDYEAYPVVEMLDKLTADKTTGKNIILATNAYSELCVDTNEHTEITKSLLDIIGNNNIQPRVTKTLEKQQERTRKKAEVFTPSWICNKMNNHCDAEWFGRENVFNIEKGQCWETIQEPIHFKKKKDWQLYVKSKRLEITCGEAPYIVSRYDASTGEMIPIQHRIGILDRKLRVIGENTDNESQWLTWVFKAYESVYGFEFQGDNLIIARINLLQTFVDYMQARWGRIPTQKELEKVVERIVWNFWQMDGITGTVPFGKPQEGFRQMTFFDFMQGINDEEEEVVDCKIYDWNEKKEITYKSIREEK